VGCPKGVLRRESPAPVFRRGPVVRRGPMSSDDPLLLGIDVGTSCIRVALFDRFGRLRGISTTDSGLEQPRPDRAEMDPEGWWLRLPPALQDCARRAGASLEEIAGVGLSSIFPAVTPVDAHGGFLRKAILYCDARSEKQASHLREMMTDSQWLAQTGNVIRVGPCALPSILWIREREPHIYQKTHSFLNGNSCLALRLTGREAMDWTNASETGLFDPQGKKEWSEPLCARLGLEPDKLPLLVPSWVCGGRVSQEAASQTGLSEGIPVAWGGGDVICSAVGSGVMNPRDLVVAGGTTDVVAYCSQRGPFSEQLLNICHAFPDRYIHMGVLLSTGRTLEWLFTKTLPRFGQGQTVSRADLIEAAAEVIPGAGGLLFLPHLEGEYTAPNDRRVGGAFIGLRSSTDWRCLLRAVLEGVALQLRLVVETIEEVFDHPIDRIPLTGGTSRSDLWNQIKADVLGRSVHVREFTESTVLGAALLGGLAAGVFPDAETAVQEMIPQSGERIFCPEPRRANLYDQLYSVYRCVTGELRSSFHKLHNTRVRARKASS